MSKLKPQVNADKHRLRFTEKLLDGVEVEWLALGEVGEVRMCKRILKKQTTETGDIPFYKIGTFGKKPNAYISQELFNEYKSKYSYPKIGQILISASGTIGRTVIFDGKDAYFQDSNIVWIENNESKISNKYLFYCYQIINWNAAEGGTIKRLYNDNLRKIKIPIPCLDNPKKSLEIQAEIVSILDTFTELTTELTTELNARKKQYNYYRDLLLSFDDIAAENAENAEVEWRALGDVVLPTKNIQWKNTTRTYHYIDLTSVSRENNSIMLTNKITAKNAPSRAKKLVEKNDVIFATTRPTQMRICLIDSNYAGEIASTGYCVLRADVNRVLPKWIFHYLTSTMFKVYTEENQSGSAYPAISDTKVKAFKISVPPLEKQKEIVRILDKFDTLTHSISEGLPREIELRKKQYEYYRDLLLSFPKPEENT